MVSLFGILGMSLAIQLVFFLPAFFLKTDKLTDLAYGLTFIVLALVIFVTNTFSVAKLVLLVMIVLWAKRLIAYLFIRIRKIERDKRFDGIRESFVKFAGFWFLQGVSVWVIMIPGLMFFESQGQVNVLSFVGATIWMIGLIVEGVADYQKYVFRNNSKNKDKWIASGLWKQSRHPNYFGEILCWVGVYIFTLNALNLQKSIIALVSPLYITTLLLFITGIPKLEKSADMKWGKNKKYQEYKRKTHVLVPFIKKAV